MLSLDMVRGGRAGFAGAFVALFLGVTLVSMTALVFASAGPRVPARYAGTAVLVRAPAAVQADGSFLADRPWPPETVRLLTDRLEAVPGVAAAVPDRSFYAQPVTGGRPDPARTEGRPWSSAALAPHRLVSGSPPAGDHEVVVDHALGLAPGSAVTLLTAAGPVPYVVSGTADGPDLYLGDAAAARLSGGVRVIGLRTAPGADLAAVEAAARTAAGSLGEVLSGDARAALEAKADARTRWIGTQVLTAVASLSGFAVVFVVASTFAFGVMRRRRDLGLLRAVGATPRQVRRMVHGEALTVGAVAALAGVAAGAALAPVFGGLLVAAGFEPPGFSVRITLWPPAAAFGGGLVVALLGTWSAARRAARVSPLEALREAAADRRPMTRTRSVLGSALTAAGIAVAVAVAGTRPEEIVTLSLLAAMALIAGIALLAPAVLPPVVRALLWPSSRTRGATWTLVREGSLTAIRRTASTTAPVLITVGFAVLVTGMVQTTAGAFALGRTAVVRAEAVVVPADGVPGLSDAVVTAVEGTAGRPAGGTAGGGARGAAGGAPLPTTVHPDGMPPQTALGAAAWETGRSGGAPRTGTDSPGGADRARGSGDLPEGREGSGGPGTVVVARRVAAERGWRAGDTIRLVFEDGRAESLRVVAVAGDAPTAFLLPRDVVRAHDPSALTPEILLPGPAPGADRLGPLGAGALGPAAYAASSRDEDDRLVWLFTLVLVGTAVGYTGVAVANTLFMAASGRVREFRVLRASGATPRQVLGVVAAESVLVTAMGSLLGAAVALPALLGIRSGLSRQVGASVPLVVPWPAVLGVVGACLVLAVAAGVLPALGAARRAR
ncbi:FtsX family ABC transporter permease [Streptosporangium pseudovulgare]|uniref:ABC transporter permease n=1 Tax=Streptosporangium pseudovulgare TaxID=35765 RepID=A0ABQ2R453_9ACTN|nr:FtsX family ABC transporter permease [Streptosporangium pseudovulgare]GGQ07846.1 ABC transporter permease [Streptosporangium pseudovulgare]